MIFQPVKPFHIAQHFGENRACKPADGTLKVISCDGNNPPAGYVSLYGPKGHTGLDLFIRHGQEIYAAHDGIVYKIDTDPKSGLDVRLEGVDGSTKIRTIYEHLMGHNVKVGDTVKTGQLIGWGDNTGWSSGDHLHFTLDIKKGDVWERVDPLLYMEPTFALLIRLQTDLVGYLKELVAKLLDNSATKLR